MLEYIKKSWRELTTVPLRTPSTGRGYFILVDLRMQADKEHGLHWLVTARKASKGSRGPTSVTFRCDDNGRGIGADSIFAFLAPTRRGRTPGTPRGGAR